MSEKGRINAAQNIYGLGGISKSAPGHNSYNTPKARFSFVIHYELSDAAKTMMANLYKSTNTPLNVRSAYNIKSVDRPSFTMNTIAVNQYNRTRLVQGRIEYAPVNLVMYDTVDSAGLMLVDLYRRFYYGDFANKSLDSWRYNTISTSRNFHRDSLRRESRADNPNILNNTWGRSTFNMGDGNGSYFFKRIDIYEIDGNRYTVHNIHNPVIETVTLDNKDYETNEPSTIQLVLRHEGISNLCPITGVKAISKPIKGLAFHLVGNGGNFSKSAFYKYWGDHDSEWSFTDILKNGADIAGAVDRVVTSVADAAIEGFTGEAIRNIAGAIGEGNILSEIGSDIGGGLGALKNIGGLF